MAYYLEHVTSDSVELQNPLSESDIIHYARYYSNNNLINDIGTAVQELKKQDWIVYEDC